MGWIKHYIFYGLAVLSVMMGLILYYHNAGFFSEGPERGFLLTKSESVRHSIYLPAFYIHILTGSIVLITGVFQLSKTIRTNYTRWHRTAGKVYMFVVLIFTAPSGLVMAFIANGGISSQFCFGLLAILWWYFTWKGFNHILQGRWMLHRAFMWRSYALTFTAVTLRLYSFFFALAGFRGESIYNIIVWLAWVPTLLVIEIWLRVNTQTGKEMVLKV